MFPDCLCKLILSYCLDLNNHDFLKSICQQNWNQSVNRHSKHYDCQQKWNLCNKILPNNSFNYIIRSSYGHGGWTMILTSLSNTNKISVYCRYTNPDNIKTKIKLRLTSIHFQKWVNNNDDKDYLLIQTHNFLRQLLIFPQEDEFILEMLKML